MNWHAQNTKEVFEKLNSSEEGLNEKEAEKRLDKYGKNELRESKKKGKFLIFLSQINSLLVYVLIFAVIISIVIGHYLDAVIIFLIIFINAFIGFFQEYKATEIIDKLKKSLQYKVLVLRDGKRKEILSEQLVLGDIVIFSEGNKVLADCRIIKEAELQVNEAVLTGESFPIEKTSEKQKGDVVLAERKNMLYAGTTVVSGNCLAVVVSTGNKTEFGKLAEMVQETQQEKMPLEKKIDEFSRNISIAIFILVLIIFIIGIKTGINTIEMILTSISLAIGAIPEGLPAIIAITLAIAVKRMYKLNTLVRKLPAAETLGRTTVICTDKTGTLTKEELNIDEVYAGKLVNINNIKKLSVEQRMLFRIGVLCNNARDEEDNLLGDPTEIALIKSARDFGIDKKKETENEPRIKEYPFSSERKMMSIVRGEKIKTSYVKGAGSFILNHCTKEFVNGKIVLITKKRKKEIHEICGKMESRGLRVLGFAFRQIARVTQEQAENHLTFSGFQGMIDLPREEVKRAIANAIDAGIEIKILTGDSALTTKAIADKIGIKGELIDGRELEKLTETEWNDIVFSKTIFSRITPQQKLKIVEILKARNEVVAVTGDGVNDILALKKADIGIAMGIKGSDVARDSSDMVLLDDNFASIINAVKEGRRVYSNLKKSIKFLLSANIGEVFIVLAALLLGMPLPFLPLAILWMNLVTDSLPALALALEPAESETMKKKPKKDGLLSGVWKEIIAAGFLCFVSSLLVFYYNLGSLEIARTMALTTTIFFELFFVFSCKSDESLFKTGIRNNKWLIYSVLVSGILHILAIYTFGGVLGLVSLSLSQLAISILVGLSGLVMFEAWKLIVRRK